MFKCFNLDSSASGSFGGSFLAMAGKLLDGYCWANGSLDFIKVVASPAAQKEKSLVGTTTYILIRTSADNGSANATDSPASR